MQDTEGRSGATMDFPSYTDRERLVDAVIHVVGIVFAIAGISVLLAFAAINLDTLGIASLAVYAAGLAAMIGFSAAYNLVRHQRAKEVLRRLDHAAIFIMIAGSYTPFALVMIGGVWGYALFGIVWAVALVGVAIKLMYPRRFERASMALYLAQGWTIVMAVGPLLSAVSVPVLALLAAGGLLYTVGILFHVWRTLNYNNAIWHVFVLAAAGCHYAAVFRGVAVA